MFALRTCSILVLAQFLLETKALSEITFFSKKASPRCKYEQIMYALSPHKSKVFPKGLNATLNSSR